MSLPTLGSYEVFSYLLSLGSLSLLAAPVYLDRDDELESI